MLLLPHNVERPMRRAPICTYSLIGLNLFIYLLTILHANIVLPGERDMLQKQIAAHHAAREKALREMERAYSDAMNSNNEYSNPDHANPNSGESGDFPGSDATSESPENSFAPHGFAPQFVPQGFSFGDSTSFRAAGSPLTAQNPVAPNPLPEMPSSRLPSETPREPSLSPDKVASGNAASGAVADGAAMDVTVAPDETLEAMRQLGKLSRKTMDQEVRLQNFAWRVEHRDDLFVLDPHPSIYAWFAYWVGAPSLLGFFASMFLHGNLEHVLGNMLFLWIFGRALEEALGPIIYVMAYLVCGVAATLLFHIATMTFSPAATMVPSLGASGAVAGLQGLFAPRFYLTNVKVFYTTRAGSMLLVLGVLLLSAFFKGWFGSAGTTLAALCVIGAIIYFGEDFLWGEFKATAVWVIGGFFLWNDVRPLLIEAYFGRNLDGVAHWAHVGGFACGLLYAFMVGLTGEAKTEHFTEEAEASLEKSYNYNALENAQQLLKLKPNDPNAHCLWARALDAGNKPEDADQALDAWELAIEKFLQAGDRDAAAKSYLEAVSHHKGFILQPRTQFLLGNHMARLGDHIGAAETLVKIPYTFPEAPEGEMSLLRSAQLYAQHLHNPALARQLLTTLLERYPHTEWKTQAESGLKNMETQMQNVSASKGLR